jgi:uncharacterized membrane protein (UPF0127 family)
VSRRASLAGALTAVAALMATSSGCSSTSALPIAQVRIGPAPIQFPVEVARTAEQRRTGLQGRDDLPAEAGMLFQFDSRGPQQVWMAGTKLPLDVAWITDGKVTAVDTLTPCTEAREAQCPRWTSPNDVDALLEVPAKALREVIPGTPVTIEGQPG